MATLRQMVNRVKRVKEAIPDLYVRAMQENAEVMAQLNREQLERGRNALGQLIRPKYASKYYANKKQRMNSKPPKGTPDIKLTGELYEELSVENQGNDFYFGSETNHTGYMTDRYDELFGLAPKSKEAYVQKDLLPIFLKKIRAALGV